MNYSEIHIALGISEKDFSIIKDIVENFSGKDIAVGVSMLMKIFTHEIRPKHFICLGILIGDYDATLQLHQQNKNNFLCLKQN